MSLKGSNIRTRQKNLGIYWINQNLKMSSWNKQQIIPTEFATKIWMQHFDWKYNSFVRQQWLKISGYISTTTEIKKK